MSWRNHNTHREETRTVKQALNDAGINCTVGHGKGTAWGWLHINIGRGAGRELQDQALKIAQSVTGRGGDWDGEINIYTQDEWKEKLGEAIPIKQPFNQNLGGSTMNKQNAKRKTGSAGGFDIEKATGEIFALEAKAKDHYRAGDECLKQIGCILISGKAALPHGEFTAWRQKRLNKSERYCQNCMTFSEKFDTLDTHGIGYSRLELLAQMEITPEVIETVAEAVSKTKATKTETGELKKLIDIEIKAGNLVRKESIEPMLAKAREVAKNNQKTADAKKIDPAIENVVTERNQFETDLKTKTTELEKVQSDLKTITGNLKKFEESLETKATEKIETERAKLQEQVEKQYSQKIEMLEQTAEKRLNEMVELQAQLADSKNAGNEIDRLKKENVSLKTALGEKGKLVREIEMYKDRIYSLEAILKSVKKNTPKDKLLEVIQQVETALHASA